MIQIRRSAIVRHGCAHMFDLVNDVEAYPHRFNWCADARVLAVMNDGALARLFEPRTHLGMSERIVDNVLAKLAGH